MVEKEIVDFPNYKITDTGIVLSKRKGWRHSVTKTYHKEENWVQLKPVLDTTGYFIVTLIGKTKEGIRVKKNKSIHRLLMTHFVDNPDNKPHINHIDGNKQNNSLSNLEWCSVQENTQHAVNHGLISYEYCETPVIQYDMNMNYIAEYKSQKEASNITGVAYQNICKVLKGKRNHAGGFIWKYKNV